MPRKNSALLQKVCSLMKIPVFLSKLKKPVLRKLVFLVKTRKLKKFKLVRQYSYCSFVKEYEFSPSSTPLIEFRGKSRNGRISIKKLHSNVRFVSKCLGMDQRSGRKERRCLETALEPWPNCVEAPLSRELAIASCSEDESSVDERAERFIQRFYEEMRRQRQECSSFQLLEM